MPEIRHQVLIINASHGLGLQLKKVLPGISYTEGGDLLFVGHSNELSDNFGIWPPSHDRMCWTFEYKHIRISTTEDITIVKECENA